jgi:hypothetical protein
MWWHRRYPVPAGHRHAVDAEGASLQRGPGEVVEDAVDLGAGERRQLLLVVHGGVGLREVTDGPGCSLVDWRSRR